MNIRAGFLFVVISLLILPLQVFSQVNSLSLQNLSSVNIDNLSDNEIRTYMVKAAENGLSEQAVYRLLKEKGLSQEEMEKLQERILLMGNKKSADNNINEKKPEDRFENKDALKIPQQTKQVDLSVFGSELFTSSSLVFEPNLRIPTPSGYIIGPDDELLINVFGLSEKSYALTVNAEGNIYIPQVGPLYVNGLSIEQASSKIRGKLSSTIYKAMRGGATRVQISLGKIKSIRVTVIGEAKKPGTYTVSSLTTVFNLLYLCGGPTDLGSYRKIELVRGNVLQRKIDLYSFLAKGNQSDNVLLKEGDVIRIPYYGTRVSLNGSVKHKGKYELREGETLNSLFEYSGGFSDDAYKAAVTVFQYTEEERKIADITRSMFGSYQPLTGDSVVVGKLLNRFTNKLTVSGAVQRPGNYEYSNNITLKDLLQKAGGVREDVYMLRGSIARVINNKPVQISFNVDSVMKNLLSVPLVKNDSVTLFSVIELSNEVYISIDGNVKNPGKYKWAENLSLRDVVLKAGGLTETGDYKNIEIARRINYLNLASENHLQTEILMIDLSDSASSVNDVILQPYDVINIRQKSTYQQQRTVFVEGMVINPGRYTLRMSGERISDIINRAGGFRANADTTALVIRRLSKRSQTVEDREKVFSKLLNINKDSLNATERIRNEIYKEYDKISIDLGKALSDSRNPENMLLEDGDILSIEQNNNLVKVSGEVYYPTIIPFKKGASLKYYIQKSGSYTELARKSGTLVVYPDGKAKKVKRFLFFTSYPEVVSRSEIFVPQKSENNRTRVTASEWAVILSSLGIIANVIVNLAK